MAKNYARHFCIFSVIFFSCSSYGYCQSRTVIKIPVLKEKAIIDTLINKVLNRNTEPGKFIDKQLLRDKCMFISIVKSKHESYLCAVELIYKESANLFINAAEHTKRDYGCFFYDGFKVFIVSDKISADFFNKIPQSKSFSFIYKMNIGKVPDRKALRVGSISDYELTNGKFLYLKPPVQF